MANERLLLFPDEIKATVMYKILTQFKTPKDLRISVSGTYWELLPELHDRRLTGTVSRWARKDVSLSMVWEDGVDTEELAYLFHPEVEARFEPYADGKPAPKLTGRAAHRAGLEAERLQAELHAEIVRVPYVDGSVEKEQVWTVRPPDYVKEDWRPGGIEKPKLNRSLANVRGPYAMWRTACLPMSTVARLVMCLNQRLDGHNDNYQHRKTTVGEILRFFGYMAALSIERGLPIDDMWRVHKSDTDLRPPPAFGAHGMSRNRFLRLRSLLSEPWEISAGSNEEGGEQDPWWRVMPYVSEFNEHYAEVLTPGSLTGPDETMCPWEGTEGEGAQSCPHKHFIPRKPKLLGCELNTQADGQCGGIYRIDIERGASDTTTRDYHNEWGYTSALNFRLAHNIINSGRIFAGDSRFMSVDAVEDLHMKGLYGLGDVKTKTSRYPVDKIKELCGPNPGDWSVMTTELEDDFPVMVVGHRRGGEVHTFIATCGLTVAGNPQEYREDLSG